MMFMQVPPTLARFLEDLCESRATVELVQAGAAALTGPARDTIFPVMKIAPSNHAIVAPIQRPRVEGDTA
jgi:hypothetical protein